MVRRTIACAIVLLAACATSQVRQASYEETTIAYPFSEATIRRPDVVPCLLKVLELGGYGNLPIERAAFLIYRDDGVFDCLLWPVTNEQQAAHWQGPAPVGIAAVVHSHPSRIPYPSPDDAYEARRMSVPIFVVTRRHVSMVSPRGEVDHFTSLEMSELIRKNREAAVTSEGSEAGEPQPTLRIARGH